MARVDLSAVAVEDLDRLIVTLSLPDTTRERVKQSLRVLEKFPRIGRKLEGRWSDFRFLLGLWRWLLIVYVHDTKDDRVLIVTIHDARSSNAATSNR